MEQIKINNRIFRKYISNNEIKATVSNIAYRIEQDYRDKNPVFLVVLTGAIFFATDLLKDMDIDCNIQLISAKSYGDKMESSGKVKIENLNMNIADRHIVIIEDIIDTGITLNSIINLLKKEIPASLSTVTLLNKPSKRIIKVDIDYKGFDIDEDFVVGYGMDYAEYGRNLQDIYILGEK